MIITQCRSVAKTLDVFSGICLFVCQHNNFRTSKHRMMKLGGRCIVQKYRQSLNLGVIAPWVCTYKCGIGNDVGKISAGCLVDKYDAHNLLISRICNMRCTISKSSCMRNSQISDLNPTWVILSLLALNTSAHAKCLVVI